MRTTLQAICCAVLAIFAVERAIALEVEILDAKPQAATAPVAPPTPEAAPVVETGSIEHVPEPTSASDGSIGQGVVRLLDAEAVTAPPAAADPAAPPPSKSPEERDRDALKTFYEARHDAPLWVDKTGLTAKAKAVIAQIKRGADWGFDEKDFELPVIGTASGPSLDEMTKAEMTLSLAAMKYARYARGGAIPEPSKQLSSYLDRKPQLRERKVLLEEIAAAEDTAAYLEGLHPKHPQFLLLHKAWLEARGKDGRKGNKAKADQLLANMQQWRWMPEDLGGMYVWVNVPEFLIRIVNNGEVVFTERITAGLVSKQTPIFSDQMERVTFKSKWIVPDSIKVREVWPSLLRGGGLMRQHGLKMEKDGQEVDWRKIDWSKATMTDYRLYQPPGPKNQLGLVKFSFPSKHYVFMHDTPDKYMFAWTRRANSHGCMRIRNPLAMATVILGADKGWDRAKIDDLVKNGPEHNVIELDKKIPVHITYLTARVEEGGKITAFGDIYGHEKRVKLALEGQLDKIAKGSDHLAPVDQERIPRVAVAARKRALPDQSAGGLMGAIFGGGF